MKQKQLWFVLVLVLVIASAKLTQASQSAAIEKVEVEIGNVFVPPQGYDNNDNVQIVLDGILPNGCYRLANHEYDLDAEKKQINVRLYANRRTDEACLDEKKLPTSLRWQVPYTIEISVGALPTGQYQIIHRRVMGQNGKQSFTVETARTSSIDDMTYAASSSVWIDDKVRGDQPIPLH